MILDIDPREVRRLVGAHAVYRMYDRDRRLLYIGMTGRAGRFDEHSVKTFFLAVELITMEWHDTQASAYLYEQRAIAAEKPLYNIAGTRKPKSGRAPKQLREQRILQDVLEVFGDERGLHWEKLASLLSGKYPRRWPGATAVEVSEKLQALGVTSTLVRCGGGVRMGVAIREGCRRGDVERVASTYAPAAAS